MYRKSQIFFRKADIKIIDMTRQKGFINTLYFTASNVDVAKVNKIY